MFNPIKLAHATVAIFRRGLIYDRFVTDTTIMKMDAVGLLRVFDAATRYRTTVESWHDEGERSRDFRHLCDALDGMKGDQCHNS